MKVALIISGYLRSFNLNIQNIREKILSRFDHVDIYFHITKDEAHNDRYLNFNKEIDTVLHELNPILLYESNYELNPDKSINNLLNLWCKYYKLNTLKSLNEIQEPYDLIIKYRPDLHLLSDNIFPEVLDPNTIYIPRESKIDIKKLRRPDDPYICDIFAFGTSLMMTQYFDFYKHILQLITPYGKISETLLYYYLNLYHINYKLVDIEYNVILSQCNVFSITGDSGSGKSKLSDVLKKHFSNSFVLECDRYHKWERTDEKWQEMTHLNPEANLITKMSSDIFDLKIGKTIYHVDYDHSTGKFTDQKPIESSDNIIVCGLHNLHGNNDNIYDLKIYVDTDPRLKTKWKIKRDVEERGNSLIKVLEQIDKRKQDYDSYIEPQKDKSDIIINFFTDDQEENVYLKLIVFNRDIHKIVNEFKKLEIDFELNVNSNNFEMIFTTFQPGKVNFYEVPVENNFYDYISLLILILYK